MKKLFISLIYGSLWALRDKAEIKGHKRFDCSLCSVTDRNKDTPWERICIGTEIFFVSYAKDIDIMHLQKINVFRGVKHCSKLY